MFWIGLLAPGLFMVMALILGAVEPQYDPIKDEISLLVHGKYGRWQTVNFLISGALMVWLGLMLHSQKAGSSQSIIWMGCVLILSGIFPTDPPDASRMSLIGMIHLLIFAIGLPVMLAAQVTAGQQHSSTPYGIYSLISAVVAVGSFIGLFFFEDAAGLLQRILLVSIMLWITVTALKLHAA